MIVSLGISSTSATFRALGTACVVHALCVFGIWAAVFWVHLDFVPGQLWLALAWLWFVWPVALSLHHDRSPVRVAVPVLLGVALLLPPAPIIFAFTVWFIQGFAP